MFSFLKSEIFTVGFCKKLFGNQVNCTYQVTLIYMFFYFLKNSTFIKQCFHGQRHGVVPDVHYFYSY